LIAETVKPDIVVEIKRARMIRAGHVQRMPEERVVKKIFTGQSGGSRRKGRPRLRWVDDLEDDLRKIGTRGWRRMAEDREGWRQAIAEVQVLQGL
jgi:hypothetical protein